MFKKYILIILFPVAVWASEDEYVIDKSHFSVGFLVEHIGYAKTLGMFKDIDGSYIHDVTNKKINDIKIVIASVLFLQGISKHILQNSHQCNTINKFVVLKLRKRFN